MDRMISDALVPPKPKLLFSTARTLRFLATWGTRSTPAQLSLGLSRLSVGGTIWSRRLRMQKIDSTAPAPPSRWPMADWKEHTSELQSLMRISSAVFCLKHNTTYYITY